MDFQRSGLPALATLYWGGNRAGPPQLHNEILFTALTINACLGIPVSPRAYLPLMSLSLDCCALIDRSFGREVFTKLQVWSCVSESRVEDVMPLKPSEERLTLMASGSFHGLENSRGGENASDIPMVWSKSPQMTVKPILSNSMAC